MAFSTRHFFKQKINSKSPYHYIKKLKYNKDKLEDRLNLVNKILENDDFFVKYFDDYFKSDLNQEDYLSEDNNICQAIEKMANYLLFSPDKLEKKSKTKYIFYTQNRLNEKIDREESIEGIAESMCDEDYTRDYGEVIEFLVDQGMNFKKEKKQEILESDYHDEEIGEYLRECKEAITYYAKLLKADNIKNYKQKMYIKNFIKEVKYSMILYKDKIKGTIYFKTPLADEGNPDWWLFNFTDEEQVSALLKCPPKNLNDDIGILVYDLNEILKQIKMSQFEYQVLEMWREVDATQETIANKLGVEQQFVSTVLKRISSKIVKKYKEIYEDWLYLNYLYGSYKKCSKCGEIKLISKFGNDTAKKDGLYSSCKTCRKE